MIAERALATTTIALRGAGPEADIWARALRGVEGVEVARIPEAQAGRLADHRSLRHEALAIASAVTDLEHEIRAALLEGQCVFVAAPTALGPRQLLALDSLARRRGCALLFDTGLVADSRLVFAAKMTRGEQALWPPRYIRSLHAGAHGTTLDATAIADIASILTLTGAPPTRVSATIPRSSEDEFGGPDTAMMALTFDDGRVARIDVSLIEREPHHEIVVVCQQRSIRIDALDERAPITIQASGRHHGPGGREPWTETVIEHPLAGVNDRAAAVAEAFVSAVRAGEDNATNAKAVAEAALVWETARASALDGGVPLPLTAPGEKPSRPRLQVIEGGGGGRASGPPPELTLVGKR